MSHAKETIATPPYRPRPTAWRAELLCLALLLLLGANLLSVLPRKTITVDEFVHIPAGYANLASGDFRPNNEHPPLVKEWAALPLLALAPRQPSPPPADSPERRTFDYARYFWEENAARFDQLTFWARVPPILLTLALGALIYGYARRLFGSRAALLAVALFSLEPTILAHGRIVHTDIAAALAYLGTCAALHAYLVAPQARRAGLLGVVVGAAFATKYSLLILLPVVGIALLALLVLAPRRGLARRAIMAQLGLVAILALLTVNLAYGFRHQPLEAIDLDWLQAQNPRVGAALRGGFDLLPPLVPPYYLLGAYTVLLHNADGHEAALLGQHRAQGWWYYFPVAFGLKTALPFLLLTIAALGWGLHRLAWRRDRRLLALLGPLALYVALACSSRINIGIRHLLPAFPFLFILGGVALDRLLRARRARPLTLGIVALTLAWLGATAARAYPDYLGYVNELARPEPRWYYLSDSNVEWGDDTVALARYLRARGETGVRAALAGGRDTLRYYDVAYGDLLAAPGGQGPETTYIALGASFLNGSTVPPLAGQPRPDYFAEYRLRPPEATFGGSIALYRVRPALPPPTTPLPESAFRATLVPTARPTRLHALQSTTVRLRLRNVGDTPWPATDRERVQQQLRLGDRWFDATGATMLRDDARLALPYDIHPGEVADLALTITAPPTPGDYLLEIDLVQEGVAWFAARGSIPLRLAIRVEP